VNKQAASVREGLERLLPRLWRFCHVLTGDRSLADDLSQSACQRALEREAQFRPETRLDEWVFRIAQSVWFNQRRAARPRVCGVGHGVGRCAGCRRPIRHR
jgi:RNA polymerase sigma-70 factor (ECF subfamily)